MPPSDGPSAHDDDVVRVSPEVLEQIDARAAAAGLTREEVVQRLLQRALAAGAGDGVDRTQIAHRLRLTPAERVARMTTEVRRLLALTNRAG